MAFDNHANFAYGTIAVVPSPVLIGTTLGLDPGDGAKMPAPPFNAVVWPKYAVPQDSNAEIVRVTAVTGDTCTIVRSQEGSAARAMLVGDQFAVTVTARTLQDVEGAVYGLASTVVAGNLPATYTLNLTGKHTQFAGTLTANCVITIAGLSAGCRLVATVTQDTAGGHTLAFTDGVTTLALPIATAVGASSLIEGWSIDGTNLDLYVR